MQRAAIAIFIGLCVLVLSMPAVAIDEWESDDGERYFSLVGAERLTGAFFHVPELPNLYPDGDDALAASVTRLLLDGLIGEHVKLEANVFLDVARQPFLSGSGAFATAGSFDSPYRTRFLVGKFWEDGSVAGRGGVDRLDVQLTFEPFSVVIGRAPVNHSVTQIFTPNDFFVPFSTTAINTLYKPGVDALTVAFAPGMLSIIQLTGVLGSGDDDVPDWGQSALLLHARNVFYETEVALFGGKLAERWVTGASVQASAGRFNIRAEGHVGFPDTDGDLSMDDIDGDGRTRDGIHARLAVGVDTFFAWHNSSIGTEYMYLSDGAASPNLYFDRVQHFFPDDQLYLGRHYVGLSAGTEIIPVLNVMVMGLMNVEDPSGMGVATLVYNVSNEADFVGGIQVPFGERQTRTSAEQNPFVPKSEFGHVPFNLFLESRFYF